jgi:hypothetical protein
MIATDRIHAAFGCCSGLTTRNAIHSRRCLEVTQLRSVAGELREGLFGSCPVGLGQATRR